MLQLLSRKLRQFITAFIMISFMAAMETSSHDEAMSSLTNAPKRAHAMSNLTTLLEEESKLRTTWIFLDKPPKEALNEEKLARMANWVSQVTAAPPTVKPIKASKRHETGDWQKGPEDEINEPAGSKKPPGCAQYGRYYCSYKEDYPV